MKKYSGNDTKTLIFDGGEEPDLKYMQEFVDGNIEVFRANPDMMMVFNDEGFIKDLPINEYASSFCPIDIRGNVIILLGDAQLK